MIVLMMSPSRCSTMWIVGLTLRHPLLRHLRHLLLVWRLHVRLFGLSVLSAWLPSVGGSFSTPSLPPLWSPVGVGSRRSFGCAAPLVRPVWDGVVAVCGVPLGGVLGGCCGLSPLCCSFSFGRGWSLFCSARLPSLLGLLCRRCPLWVAAALLLSLVSSVALGPKGAKSEIRLDSGIGSRFR